MCIKIFFLEHKNLNQLIFVVFYMHIQSKEFKLTVWATPFDVTYIRKSFIRKLSST